MSKFLDGDGLSYLWSTIKNLFSGKVDKETGKGLSTNDYTTSEKSKLADIEAQANKTTVDAAFSDTSTNPVQNKVVKSAIDAVNSAIDNLPNPMIFKGTLGTGGTVTTLPAASSSNVGFTYKVITAGTYQSIPAKVGDTFISDGSAWVLIPSGDEPSGTVTNVAVTGGTGVTISGSPITTSGTINVGLSMDSSPTSGSSKPVTSGGIYTSQQTQETEIGVVANAGAKNLFRCTYLPGDTVTVGGVTFTFNADGSITANGTKTNNDWLRLSVGNTLKAGTYELSSNVDGENGNKTVLIATGDSLSDAIMRTNTASGKTTKTLTQDYSDLRFVLRIVSGQVCTNEVYKIMLRDTRVTDDTFVPYAPTNRVLFESEESLAASQTTILEQFEASRIKYEDTGKISLDALTWHSTSSGSGMLYADAYVTTGIDVITSVVITSYGAFKTNEMGYFNYYIPSSVSGMHTVRVICDKDLTGLASKPYVYFRVFGYGTRS